MSLFSVHGEYQITIEDNIVTIDVSGPWNLEFFLALHQDLSLEISKVKPKDYSVLLIPRGNAIAVEEALELHVDFISRATAKAVAVVLAHSDIPLVTKSMCEKVYVLAKLPHEFFEDTNEAKVWLQQQMQGK